MRKVNLRNVDPAIDDPDASTWCKSSFSPLAVSLYGLSRFLSRVIPHADCPTPVVSISICRYHPRQKKINPTNQPRSTSNFNFNNPAIYQPTRRSQGTPRPRSSPTLNVVSRHGCPSSASASPARIFQDSTSSPSSTKVCPLRTSRPATTTPSSSPAASASPRCRSPWTPTDSKVGREVSPRPTHTPSSPWAATA